MAPASGDYSLRSSTKEGESEAGDPGMEILVYWKTFQHLLKERDGAAEQGNGRVEAIEGK